MERLVLGATHLERSAGDGNHIDRSSRAGDCLRKVLKRGHGRCSLVNNAVRHYGSTRQRLVLVIGVVVSRIEVAADTLQVEFLLVLIVIEVRCYTLIGNTLGIDVDVASLARLVIDDGLSILQLAMYRPIHILGILGHIGPQILHTGLGLRHDIIQ